MKLLRWKTNFSSHFHPKIEQKKTSSVCQMHVINFVHFHSILGPNVEEDCLPIRRCQTFFSICWFPRMNSRYIPQNAPTWILWNVNITTCATKQNKNLVIPTVMMPFSFFKVMTFLSLVCQTKLQTTD